MLRSLWATLLCCLDVGAAASATFKPQLVDTFPREYDPYTHYPCDEQQRVCQNGGHCLVYERGECICICDRGFKGRHCDIALMLKEPQTRVEEKDTRLTHIFSIHRRCEENTKIIKQRCPK